MRLCSKSSNTAAIPTFILRQSLLAFPNKSLILRLDFLRVATIKIPRILLRPLGPFTPRNAIFDELLHLGLQGRPLQLQVVYLTNPHDQLTRPARGHPIHQTPTIAAEVVCHSVPRRNSLVHRERFDYVLAPYVLQRFIADSEI